MSGRVLITGATSGIGRQLALDYRRAGWQVWGCGRDEVRLQALADLGITPLRFDARDSAAMAGVAASLPVLDQLILNAGNCEYMDPAEGFDGALFAGSSRPTSSPPATPWPPCCRGWGRVDGLPSSAPR